MTEAEKAATLKWIAAWKRAAPVLQQVRDADIRAADTAHMIECTTSLFRDAIKHFPPRAESGLVEQQRWFKLARKA